MTTLDHRLVIRLSASEITDLRDRARCSGASLSETARRLMAQALAQVSSTRDERDLVTLAGLVATEHVGRLLQSIVPDGATRSRDLRSEAMVAADERLAELRRRLEFGGPD